MPLREVEARFTKSELAIVAWRSREVYEQVTRRTRQTPAEPDAPALPPITDLPEKFFNPDGELDLRGVTGPEALAYLSGLGLHIPVMPPKSES